MNIIDVIIVLMILCAGVVGLKRGFFKEIVMTVGLLLVYILAFKLKDPVAHFLSLNLPFFEFGGALRGATALNIILYQAIAFIIVFAILMIIFRIVLIVSKTIEKILNFTIILGIPSKILGFIVGIVEGYIIMFIFCFVISQPFLNIDVVQQSKYKDKILASSPVLSKVASTSYQAITEVYYLEKDFIEFGDVEYFNEQTLNILLNYNIIDQKYIDDLNAEGKL